MLMFIMTSFTGPVLILLMVLFVVLLIEFVLSSRRLSLFFRCLVMSFGVPVNHFPSEGRVISEPSFSLNQLRAPPVF